MNNEQLENCLANLKSSSREPDTIDDHLEERLMNLHSNLGKRRMRTQRLVALIALLMVAGTGFVALGGDSAVFNLISPSTEIDSEGNPVPHDFSIGKWMRGIHDHVWEHFKSHHE